MNRNIMDVAPDIREAAGVFRALPSSELTLLLNAIVFELQRRSEQQQPICVQNLLKAPGIGKINVEGIIDVLERHGVKVVR